MCRPLVIALRTGYLLSNVTWIGGSGDWSTGTNWSNGTGPGPTDDAVIDVAGITVTHSTGSDTIQSLTANDAFNLSGGALTVTGNVQDQNGNPFTLTGGTLSGATVAAGTTITGTSSGGTLAGVTLAGTLDVGDGVLTVTNGLTLDGGFVDLNEAGQVTFAGTQTLGGTGAVTFVAGSALVQNHLVIAGGSTLTIAPDITIQGDTGTIGNYPQVADVSLVNQGTIADDTAGGLITIQATSLSNSGTIRATAGGVDIEASWTSSGALAPTAAAI